MYQLITNVITFSLDTYIWFRASTFWCGDIKSIGWYVIHDSIVCYSLWVDAMYFELQTFLQFHCSSSVRTYHKCSNLAICIAIIFHRFYDNNCSDYRFWQTNCRLISNWYQKLSITTPNVLWLPFVHCGWIVTFTGAIHFSNCSNLP